MEQYHSGKDTGEDDTKAIYKTYGYVRPDLIIEKSELTDEFYVGKEELIVNSADSLKRKSPDSSHHSAKRHKAVTNFDWIEISPTESAIFLPEYAFETLIPSKISPKTEAAFSDRMEIEEVDNGHGEILKSPAVQKDDKDIEGSVSPAEKDKTESAIGEGLVPSNATSHAEQDIDFPESPAVQIIDPADDDKSLRIVIQVMEDKASEEDIKTEQISTYVKAELLPNESPTAPSSIIFNNRPKLFQTTKQCENLDSTRFAKCRLQTVRPCGNTLCNRVACCDHSILICLPCAHRGDIRTILKFERDMKQSDENLTCNYADKCVQITRKRCAVKKCPHAVCYRHSAKLCWECAFWTPNQIDPKTPQKPPTQLVTIKPEPSEETFVHSMDEIKQPDIQVQFERLLCPVIDSILDSTNTFILEDHQDTTKLYNWSITRKQDDTINIIICYI